MLKPPYLMGRTALKEQPTAPVRSVFGEAYVVGQLQGLDSQHQASSPEAQFPVGPDEKKSPRNKRIYIDLTS